MQKASESQRCRYVSYIYKSHIMKYRYAKASESQRCRYVSYIYKSHNMIYRYAKASESQRCRYVSYIYKSKKYDTQVCKSFSHCGVTMFHTYIRVKIWYTRMQKVHSHIASYTSRVHTDLTWNKIGTTTCKWLECNTQRYTYTHIYIHTQIPHSGCLDFMFS